MITRRKISVPTWVGNKKIPLFADLARPDRYGIVHRFD